MGLITLALLVAFTLLYLAFMVSGKVDALDKLVSAIRANIEKLSVVAIVYALVALVLTPVLIYGALDMVVRLLANLALLALALPHGFERLIAGHADRFNAVVLQEIRGIVSWISSREKLAGYAGAALSVLLFAVMFR